MGGVIILGAVALAFGAAFALGGKRNRRGAALAVRPAPQQPPQAPLPTAPAPEPAPEPVPPAVAQVVTAAQEGTATIEQLEQAGKLAGDAGAKSTAEYLHDQAETLRALDQHAAARAAAPVKSPIEGVSDAAWGTFVAWGRQAKPSTITANYNLGAYLTNMRTLVDQGLAKNERQVDYNGRKVWQADWVPPHTLERFLADAELQYQVFRRQMVAHAKHILKTHRDQLGKTIEGKTATLSGLLGASKQAGLGGLAKWLANDNRKSATTEAYLATTGLF